MDPSSSAGRLVSEPEDPLMRGVREICWETLDLIHGGVRSPSNPTQETLLELLGHRDERSQRFASQSQESEEPGATEGDLVHLRVYWWAPSGLYQGKA